MLPNLNETDSPMLVEMSKLQSFYVHRNVEEIVKERGLKPVRREYLYPEEPIWDSEEDFNQFWSIVKSARKE